MSVRINQFARYARLSAAVALLLVLTVAAVYGYRAWQRARAQRDLPEAVPAAVKQISAGFTFSKVDHERTLFTITASRTTEFAEGNRASLDNVSVTIFGRTGARNDRLSTEACEFQQDTGRMTCAGEVRMELESAEDSRRRPGQKVIHVKTSNLTFDSKQDVVAGDAPVRFEFPGGQGSGLGVHYSAADAAVRLGRPVNLELRHNPAAPPILLEGGQLEVLSESRSLKLAGPVRARQSGNEIDGGRMTLALDSAFRAERLGISDRAALRLASDGNNLRLTSQELVAQLRPDGTAARLLATGGVDARLTEPPVSRGARAQESHLTAQRLDLEMNAAGSAPQSLVATDRVSLEQQSPAGVTRLDTQSLRVGFANAANSGDVHASFAEAPAASRLHWQRTGESGSLQSGRLRLDFASGTKPQLLTAQQNVTLERKLGPQTQRASSTRLTARFNTAGEWSDIEQSGNVRIEDSGRTAEAARAMFTHSSDSLTLSGSATVPATIAEGSMRTSARTISLDRRTGELRADGAVRSTYRPAAGDSPVSFGSQQGNITASRLVAAAQSGRATYSGNARFWQGDVVVQADSIELDKNPRRMHARGHVHAVFPQQSAADASRPKVLWNGQAGSFVFTEADGKARLSEKVLLASTVGEFRCAQLDLFLARSSSGALELDRAEATGGVDVRTQSEGQDRRGNSEKAVYSASDGKITLSGGNPTLVDAVLGITRGDQLTYFLASDTILVDSVQGTRTLTRHRTEK